MAVKRIYLRAGDPRVLIYRNQNIACFVYFCLFSNVLDILINNWLMKDWRFVNIQELVNIFLTCELLCWQRNVKETIEVKNKQTIVQDKKSSTWVRKKSIQIQNVYYLHPIPSFIRRWVWSSLISRSFQDFFFNFSVGTSLQKSRLKSVKLPSLKVICWKPASRKFVSVGQDLIPSDATQTFSKIFDFVLALDVSTLNLV